MALYNGFSTIGLQNRWKLSDTELVKRDILNHFQTRRGERVMNPGFGSQIWEFVFEPGTKDLQNAILEDATRIIESDPRVVAKDITVTQFQYGFQIEMDLYFVNQGLTEPMYVQFNQEAQVMTSI
jgi:phage baseplate assembly protein W